MATLTLMRAERHGETLPDVCVRCGHPATARKAKTFNWFSPWVYFTLLLLIVPLIGVIAFLLTATIATKRMGVTLPLCREHLHHWRWRTLTILFTFLLLCLIGLAGLLVAMDRNINPDIGELTCPCCAVGLMGWMIQAIILHLTSIRAISITDYSITLSGISPRFLA
jgi:hypothetical protein